MRVSLSTFGLRGDVEPIVGFARQLAASEDQDDRLVVGEVNQQALFRRVAAVVHHGGPGTTMTAAQAGAPQPLIKCKTHERCLKCLRGYWRRKLRVTGPPAESVPAPECPV
jgi:UDP:flavonoid glycosyltransferase YjiC (YdhE family)